MVCYLEVQVCLLQTNLYINMRTRICIQHEDLLTLNTDPLLNTTTIYTWMRLYRSEIYPNV